jgi:hypothetical protein
MTCARLSPGREYKYAGRYVLCVISCTWRWSNERLKRVKNNTQLTFSVQVFCLSEILWPNFSSLLYPPSVWRGFLSFSHLLLSVTLQTWKPQSCATTPYLEILFRVFIKFVICFGKEISDFSVTLWSFVSHGDLSLFLKIFKLVGQRK